MMIWVKSWAGASGPEDSVFEMLLGRHLKLRCPQKSEEPLGDSSPCKGGAFSFQEKRSTQWLTEPTHAPTEVTGEGGRHTGEPVITKPGSAWPTWHQGHPGLSDTPLAGKATPRSPSLPQSKLLYLQRPRLLGLPGPGKRNKSSWR